MHQGLAGVHALALGMLFLQLAQLGQVRDRHARELVLLLVASRPTGAVLSAHLTDLCAHLDLLEEADYLRFAESGFLHAETPLGGFSTPGWLRFSRGLHRHDPLLFGTWMA